MTNTSDNWKSDFKEILVDKVFKQEQQVVKHISVGAGGDTYICQLWEGIIIWANSVHMEYIDYPDYEGDGWRYVALNICNEGRCEVSLKGDKYIYMVPGSICISSTAPEDGFVYPGELYTGIELAFDIDILTNSFPKELSSYGINIDSIKRFQSDNDDNFMGTVSELVQQKSRAIYDYLVSGDMKLEDYRFYVLEILYLILNGNTFSLNGKSYVTRGQRRIAVETERIITEDLSSHHTVEAIAKRFQVSPSALKKYFEAVYGVPISRYVKEQRMKNATVLLTSTSKSVGEIAMLSGYENQGKFGSAFKNYTGVTPLEYRRINRVI
ncbi:MAG: AraC family transcriptional regulator [Pseudobutyrivibrio sp.]|nr:AraC family transcriptional regulator [Pseudobutyrivibrio sp.]